MDEATKEKLINSLKDIHGYIAIQIPNWLIITFCTAFVLVLGYFLWKKFKKKDSEDHRSKEEIILEELKNLENDTNSEKFYVSFSEKVRQYFDYRFELAFTDKTTREIEKDIFLIKELETHQAKLLIKSLERADLAKFAKKDFKDEEKLQDIYDAIDLINKIEEKLNNSEEEEKLELL